MELHPRVCNRNDELNSGRINIGVISCFNRFYSSVILTRIQSLFAIVIAYLGRTAITELEENEPPFEINVANWSGVLPTWFLEITPLEISRQRTPHLYSGNIFTIESWQYWFINPYQSRNWKWLKANIHNSTTLEIVVEVIDTPFPWETLRWALIAAGAESVCIN